MIERIRKLIAPPAFPGKDYKSLQAKQLSAVILGIVVGLGMSALGNILIDPTDLIHTVLLLANLPLLIMTTYLLHRGNLRFAGLLLLLGLYASFVYSSIYHGGVRSFAFGETVTIVLVASLLLGVRVGISFAVLNFLTGLVLALAETNNVFQPATIDSPVSILIHQWSLIPAILVVLYLAIQNVRTGFQRAQEELRRRTQAEVVLRESAGRYYSIFDGIRDAIFIEGLNGEILHVNQRACEMYGWSRDEFLTKTVADLVPKGYLAVIPTEIPNGDLPEQPVETVNLRANGEQFPVEITTALETIDDNTVMFVVVRDITKRKKFETELRESEEKYRKMIQEAPDGIVTISLMGEVTSCNDAFLELAGYAENEIVGKHFSKLPTARTVDIPTLAEFFKSVIKREPISPFEFPWIHKDGSTHFGEIHVSPSYDDRNLIGIQAIIRDITDRKRVEQTLRLTQFCVDNATDAIFWIDQDAKFAYVNNAACHSLGYTRKELFSMTLHDIDPYFLVDSWPEHWEKVKQRGTFTIESQHHTKQGDFFPVEITANYLEFEKKEHICVFARNISERVRSEQLIRDLNQTAVAMERATSFEEVFDLVVEEFKQQGLTCSLLTIDKSQTKLIPIYLSYGEKAIKAAEKLAGIRKEDLSIEIDRVNTLRRAVREKETVFDADIAESMRQLLPKSVKRHAEQIAKFLGISKSIIAPFIVDEKIIGVCSIHSDDLREADIPTLTTFIHQMAGIFHKHRIMQDLKNSLDEREQAVVEINRRITHQEAINAVISAAVAAPNLQELLETTLSLTLSAMNLEMGIIWVGDNTANSGFPPEIRQAGDNTPHLPGVDVDQPIAVDNWQEIAIIDPLVPMIPFTTRFGIQSSLTVPIKVKDRRIGQINLTSPSPRHWSEDEITLAQSISREIGGAAERLQLLQKTEEQAHQVQLILDSVQDGILTLDNRGHILSTNPTANAYLEILSTYNPNEVITHLGGHSLSELLASPPEDLPYSIEITEPSRQIFEVHINPVRNGLEIKQWTLVIRDVTHVREIHERAILQERLAAVGELAAGIAHDFNNLLVPITLYSQMLLLDQDFETSNRERMEAILNQARQASSLTEQILDFSRQAVMDFQWLDMVSFLKEFTNLLRRTLLESIRVELIHEDEDYTLNVDPARLQQVFMNLALNARDAMPDGGLLRFELSRLQVELDQPPFRDMAPGSWVRIRVADTGIGIDPKHLPHIFEPFFSTKEPGMGTGLGLAQVYGIIKQHDGYIDVHSQVNEGTTFTIYLPVKPVEEISETPSKEGIYLEGDLQTILLVEDNEAVRRSVYDVLKKLRYRVLHAENGREAIEIFDREKIDLVLSDLIMPEMGGIELFETLREKDPNLKMIILTGYPLGEEMRPLKETDNVTFAQKPLDIETISMTLKRVFEE